MERQVNKLLDSVYFRLSLTESSIINFEFEKTLAIRTYRQLLEISKDNHFLGKIIREREKKSKNPDFSRVLSRLNFYTVIDKISDKITGQEVYDAGYITVSNLQPITFKSSSDPEWKNYLLILFFSIIDVILEVGNQSQEKYVKYIISILQNIPLPIKEIKELLSFFKGDQLEETIEMLSDFGDPLKIDNKELCISVFQRLKLFNNKAFNEAGSSIMQLLQDKKTGRVFKWEDICADPSKSTELFTNLVPFDTTGLSKREICAILAEDVKEEKEEEPDLNLEGSPIPKYRSYDKTVGDKTYKYDIFDMKKLVDQEQIWDPYHRFKLDYKEINHRYTTLVQTLKRSALGDVLDEIKQNPLETTKGRLIKVWFKFKYPVPIETFMTWELEKYSLLTRYLEKGISENQVKQINFGVNEHNRIRLLKIWASILDELTSENEEMASRVEQAIYIVNES